MDDSIGVFDDVAAYGVKLVNLVARFWSVLFDVDGQIHARGLFALGVVVYFVDQFAFLLVFDCPF